MDVRSYSLVTAAYWGFTLTDGALRMLVLFHFHHLGYSSLDLAFLFLLYEFMGVLTNLFGGWVGSRLGLRVTLFAGLGLQVFALVMLSLVQPHWLLPASVAYVMVAQAISGVAKDLTKMSSKSAVKLLVKGDDQTHLFKWVALLTGSKNALKGLGFLLGGVLLTWFGFAPSLWLMAAVLAAVLASSMLTLQQDMGKTKDKVKFKHLFAKSREINILSLARMFLFSSRDVWFVVGLPVFLYETLGWSFSGVGAFLAMWVIGYGGIQAIAPKLLRKGSGDGGAVWAAQVWGFILAAVTGAIALALHLDFHPMIAVLGGLALFAVAFAVNSSVHSYLILAYTDSDKVALNVGFYYMANAIGRLLGTLLSGLMYMVGGLPACLWVSTGSVLAAAVLTLFLPVVQFAHVSPDLAAVES